MQTTTPGRIDLNRNPDESVVLHALVLPIAENAAGAAGAVIPVQIIPPPGPGGVLPARDGRRQRVPDIAALVARLNRQSVAARVDTDHHSEPTSPRFKGTTAADGWLSNYRVDSAGGITADMEPNPGLREKIREKRYRYASPALFLREDGEVLGLSSLALVNDPNMPLRAPVMHSLARREAELARRKAAVERTLNRAAEMVVDTAILGGDIAAHHRDYYLGAIRSHEEGIGAGVNAFVELSRSGGLQPPVRFTTPFGCEEPRAERLELHNQIAHRASRQSTTYLEAAAEFAAETREVAIPEGWQAPRGARMALHRQISANALESGVPYREAAERTEDYARVTVPTGWQAPREARMALHAALARFALELGIPYREAITRLAGAPTGQGQFFLAGS